LDQLIEEELQLLDYQLNSVGSGKDALAESHVQLKVNGTTVNGRGAAQDVLEASGSAFLNAVNRYIVQQNTVQQKELIKNWPRLSVNGKEGFFFTIHNTQ